jgi:hypothetical protein
MPCPDSASGVGGGTYNDIGGTPEASHCVVVSNAATGTGGGKFNNGARGKGTVN